MGYKTSTTPEATNLPIYYHWLDERNRMDCQTAVKQLRKAEEGRFVSSYSDKQHQQALEQACIIARVMASYSGPH